MESKKIGFFKRVRIAITKLEDYGDFLQEKTSTAVKYFFILVLLYTIIVTVSQTYLFAKMFNKAYTYIKNELPDFSYENEILQFDEIATAYDKEQDFYMIADTSDNIEEAKINEYKDTIKSNGVLILRNKIIVKASEIEEEFTYKDLHEKYEFENLNKQQVIEKIDSMGIFGLTITMLISLAVLNYIPNIIVIFVDWLLISIFAYFVSKICRVNIKFKQGFCMSIYALTLSIILSALYNVASYGFDFYIEYFRTIYMLIAYVYVIAAILIIKSDMIKQNVEISKIEEVQKEIKEELESEDESKEKKEKPDDDKKSDDKESEEGVTSRELDESEI